MLYLSMSEERLIKYIFPLDVLVNNCMVSMQHSKHHNIIRYMHPTTCSLASWVGVVVVVLLVVLLGSHFLL